ncbi:MAG: hypothetical protein ACYC3I_06355 [Gemmataceae bacterium]
MLGTTYWKLFGLIRGARIEPPQRDSSGDFIWLEEDLDRARIALAAPRKRQYKREEKVSV